MKFKAILATLVPIISLISLQVPVFAAVTVPADLAVVKNVAVHPSTNAPYLNGSITVTWDASLDALQYTVLASRIGTSETKYVSVGKEATQAILDRLVGGATYIVQVRVIGNGHVSPWTSNTLTSVPVTLPNAPAQPTATAEVGSATINWVDLIGNESGGAPVTEYKITETFSNKTVRAAASDSSAKMLGLTEGANASFTVSAITSSSPDGVSSVTSNLITILAASVSAPGGTPQDVPGSPRIPFRTPMPTPTPTPTSTPTPEPNPIFTDTPTVSPAPIASSAPEASTSPLPKSQFNTVNHYFEILKNRAKGSKSIRLNGSLILKSLLIDDSLQIVLPKVAKNILLKSLIQTPDKKSSLLYSVKTSKFSDVIVPTLKFKRAGNYSLTFIFSTFKKTLIIKVVNPAKSRPNKLKDYGIQQFKKTLTVVCINGKISKDVSGVNPLCPSGFHRK
jgi:hypothetical protein